MSTTAILTLAFTRYAESQPDFRAAFIVGSQARSDHPADQWSDVDVILFCREPERLINDAGWLSAIAPVWVSVVSKTVSGEPERLTVFEGGAQMDVVFHSVADIAGLRAAVEDGQIPETVRRGVRLLLDKDNLLPAVPPPQPVPERQPPTAAEFTRLCEWFLFGAVYLAKQLRREDVPFYKDCEAQLRQQLVTLLEWHARANYGPGHDTWHRGRFMSLWADQRVMNSLPDTYAGFDLQENWWALLALVNLFRWAARETADRIGVLYPNDADARIWEYVQQLAAEHVAALRAQRAAHGSAIRRQPVQGEN